MRRSAIAWIVPFGFAACLAQADFAVETPDENMAKSCPRAESRKDASAAPAVAVEKKPKKDEKDKPREWRLEAL